MSKTRGFQESPEDDKQRLYEERREKSIIEKRFESFIKEKRFLANLSERTLHSYGQVFDRWIKYIGHELPTEENLKTFVLGMREAGLSIGTCNLSIRSLNSFLTWLHRNGHIPQLRVRQIKETKRVMKTFSDAQLQVLLQWKPNTQSRNEIRMHTIMLLLLDTGVRISEALSLRLDKVDFDNLLVTVKGKGNKERTLPISLEMRKALYRYVNKYRTSLFQSPYVFCTSSGTMVSYQNACRELMRICRKLDIDMDQVDGVFHAFRRKFARNYVKSGGNLMYLMQVMGHTTLKMTKEYVYAEDEDLQEVQHKTSILGRLLGKK